MVVESMISVVEGSTPAPLIASDGIRALQGARQAVGTAAPQLWATEVRRRDPVETIRRGMNRQPINRAYFKLCEMQKLLPPKVEKALFLCEAPGGFYQAARRLYPDVERVATSLCREGSIPFHRMVEADVLELPSEGDIRNAGVIQELVALVGPNSCDLVTADGGIDHEDLDTVEQSSLTLLIGQVVAALRLTKAGGSCVIKLFEGSTQPTRDVVSVVRKAFSNIHLYKPRTSKAANSERYLIANGLLDVDRAATLADQLAVCMTIPHPLTLVDTPDTQVAAAFDALAAKQTREIHLLINATRQDPHARREVEQLLECDLRWVQENVSCLCGAMRRVRTFADNPTARQEC